MRAAEASPGEEPVDLAVSVLPSLEVVGETADGNIELSVRIRYATRIKDARRPRRCRIRSPRPLVKRPLQAPRLAPNPLDDYLALCKDACDGEIKRLYGPGERGSSGLYDLILDYPLRGGKALRPALSIATCLGLGGHLEAILPTAATLELYHNAFLIHDDIEDESWWRRGKPTLHIDHGVPIAVNVGDAMLSLSLQPLLDNVERVGLGPALRILRAVAHMTRQTVEGQALELEWVRSNTWRARRRRLPRDGGARRPAGTRSSHRCRSARSPPAPDPSGWRRWSPSAGTSERPSRSPTTC